MRKIIFLVAYFICGDAVIFHTTKTLKTYLLFLYCKKILSKIPTCLKIDISTSTKCNQVIKTYCWQSIVVIVGNKVCNLSLILYSHKVISSSIFHQRRFTQVVASNCHWSNHSALSSYDRQQVIAYHFNKPSCWINSHVNVHLTALSITSMGLQTTNYQSAISILPLNCSADQFIRKHSYRYELVLCSSDFIACVAISDIEMYRCLVRRAFEAQLNII